MKRTSKTIQYVVAGIFIAIGMLFPAAALAADGQYGEGDYGACTYNTCGITVSSSGTVNLTIIPGSSATCTTQKDSVVVTTDASTGYNLSMNNAATTSSLLNGGSSIATTSGTQVSPIALTANTWGYRIDGLAGFGAGPTAASSNTAASATSFAGIPTSAQPAATLAATTVAAGSGETTSVWYGACANTTLPAGTYTSTIIYTAVVN